MVVASLENKSAPNLYCDLSDDDDPVAEACIRTKVQKHGTLDSCVGTGCQLLPIITQHFGFQCLPRGTRHPEDQMVLAFIKDNTNDRE